MSAQETELINPFDDEKAEYLVLVNEEGERSLWPAFADPPTGWAVAHARDSRRNCLSLIESESCSAAPL